MDILGTTRVQENKVLVLFQDAVHVLINLAHPFESFFWWEVRGRKS